MSVIMDIWYTVVTQLKASGVSDFIDIAVLAFLIYQVIKLVRQTRTAQLAKGLVILGLFYFVVDATGMRAMRFLLDNLMSFGLIALVVVFQPELRRALEQVGRANIFGFEMFRGKLNYSDERVRWQNAIVAVCDSAERLAETRTGALIVLERRTNLSEILRTGTRMNAYINTEVLGTIFYVGTPLHDGAVVVRNGRVEAAGCFLPLSDNLEIGKDMGTRHRAALGMSENSDALVVVVSEETGIISLAKNGVLIRRLDRQALFHMLEMDMVPPAVEDNKKPWFKRGHKDGEN